MVIDHLATVVDARVTAKGPGAGRLQRPPRIDVRALTDPHNREKVSQILEDAPRPAWEVSAHSHVAIVTSYLQDRLTAAFPQQASRPFQAYLTADTWALQKQVADALYGFRLGVFAKSLRHRCKEDRVAYVEGLADSVQANEGTAFQAVNQLLGRRRKKPFAPAVLPVVQQQDGAPCSSPDAATRRWREHFSALEDGVEVTCSQLVEAAYKGAGRAWPTPLDLQRALLAAKRGKACGPDAIPGELGLLFASGMQKLLYPLMLKLGLLGEEALTWLWKGRGSKTDCASYRGILLLSNLCKAIHRAYRPCIQQHFAQHASPLQLGGKKGSSVVFGSHAMRTFLRARASQGRTSAIIFADVSSAYYCTLRELASRLASSDMRPNDVSGASDALCLEYQLREPPALAQQGAHPWLQALTEALNQGTWMHLKGDSVPIATRRGTRPGSAWADLTFGVLRPNKVQGEVPNVPWDSRRDWGPPESPGTTLLLDDLIWADDLATCLDVLQVADAPKVVSAEAGALTDAFEAHGFPLSYGVKKTAALVCPKGPGARSVCRELFSGQSTLTILCEQRGPAQLPLVDCYKHLGVMQARDGSIKQEIKARCAAAWTTFREGRTRLFRCRRVATRRRGVLLQTLVMSKLLFGCGAWPPLGVGDRQRFSGAVFSLYRATLGLQVSDSQHLTLATICSLLGLLDYASLLRVEQLQYLRQLCATAPDALWALIRQDPPYLQLLREALHWLFVRVKATCHLADPEVAFEAWRVLICDRPSLFKGLEGQRTGVVPPYLPRGDAGCACCP
eukprot:s6818_g4.t1